ncbi:PfkB family carbohydrate kinase [Rhodococcus koreensis]|uniref:PfkB family carbohydrate kinase n=1 Tax=Rhodococcus koreensis TaxID=99653 RepID=UPI00366E0609
MTVMTEPTSEVTGEAIASNVSLGLEETRLTTFGTNPHGGAIDHELTRCGVRVIQAGHPAARTSTTTTGPGRPDAHTDVPSCAHLHIGSLAVGRAPGVEDVARLVSRQHPDTTISYDVSVTPSAMGPQDTAIAQIDEMISRSDIVKLSDEDLAWLRPGDRHGDAIRWLMSRGPAILVLTHSDTAATGYTRSGSVRVRGRRVEVANTAEWGDTFMAGLLHALTGRDLLAHRTDRRLRSIGLDDVRRILRDANLFTAQSVTPAAVRTPRLAALAPAGSCEN